MALEKQFENKVLAFCRAGGHPVSRLSAIGSDASFRRYFRAEADTGQSFLVMDSPPNLEPLVPFISLSDLLRQHGYAAPHVVYAAPDDGLALIEDFGDLTFSRALAAHPSRLEALYHQALDLLISLAGDQGLRAETVPAHDVRIIATEMTVFLDWFPSLDGQPLEHALRPTVLDAILSALSSMIDRAEQRTAFVHGDFHFDNLMCLEGRDGLASIGVLDFQDAMLGSPFYDVMSLVEDARRDVDANLSRDLKARFQAAWTGVEPSLTPSAFSTEWAQVALERHLRILGTFVRLAQRDGKFGYLVHLPRVAQQAQQALAHPALAPLAVTLDAHYGRFEDRVSDFLAVQLPR